MDLTGTTTVIAELKDHVLTITLDRPDKLNSFTDTMRAEFRELWHYASETDDVHVVVLRANGERAFSTGVDVHEGTFLSDNVFSRRDPGVDLSPKQNNCWKPLVCAVHGMVAGGALYWLNEADIIVASEDAQFFDPHVSYGLVCAVEPVGQSYRLPLQEVLRIALLGNDERVSAPTALRIGLVSEVLPKERLWERAHELAAKIANKPPLAVQGTVRAIWESLDLPRREALNMALKSAQIGLTLPKPEAHLDAMKQTRTFEVR